jgi:hypothetical protein
MKITITFMGVTWQAVYHALWYNDHWKCTNSGNVFYMFSKLIIIDACILLTHKKCNVVVVKSTLCIGVRDGGGGGAGAAPNLLGRPGQSGNICFTFGQYWLIIKNK